MFDYAHPADKTKMFNQKKCMFCVLEHNACLETNWSFSREKMTVDQISSNTEGCFCMDVLGTHGVVEGND